MPRASRALVLSFALSGAAAGPALAQGTRPDGLPPLFGDAIELVIDVEIQRE
jgi:hypothetical protein